jgi:hypothetical protein
MVVRERQEQSHRKGRGDEKNDSITSDTNDLASDWLRKRHSGGSAGNGRCAWPIIISRCSWTNPSLYTSNAGCHSGNVPSASFAMLSTEVRMPADFSKSCRPLATW